MCTVKIPGLGVKDPLGPLVSPGTAAEIAGDEVFFRGNLLDPGGEKMFSIEKRLSLELAASLGINAAHELLRNGGSALMEQKQHV
jgi:porphobilinogen deaminase